MTFFISCSLIQICWGLHSLHGIEFDEVEADIVDCSSKINRISYSYVYDGQDYTNGRVYVTLAPLTLDQLSEFSSMQGKTKLIIYLDPLNPQNSSVHKTVT